MNFLLLLHAAVRNFASVDAQKIGASQETFPSRFVGFGAWRRLVLAGDFVLNSIRSSALLSHPCAAFTIFFVTCSIDFKTDC